MTSSFFVHSSFIRDRKRDLTNLLLLESNFKMADSDDIDLYEILGVSKRASIADIKKVRTTFAKSLICCGELERSAVVCLKTTCHALLAI